MGRSKAILSRRQGRAGEGGNAPHRRTMPCLETQHREHSMGSIDLSGLPPRVVEAAARVLCVARTRRRPRRRREATSSLAMSWGRHREPGRWRFPIERDGQSWFRVATPTIMTSLGPVTYRRARYRSGASGASPPAREPGFDRSVCWVTRHDAVRRARRSAWAANSQDAIRHADPATMARGLRHGLLPRRR